MVRNFLSGAFLAVVILSVLGLITSFLYMLVQAAVECVRAFEWSDVTPLSVFATSLTSLFLCAMIGFWLDG